MFDMEEWEEAVCCGDVLKMHSLLNGKDAPDNLMSLKIKSIGVGGDATPMKILFSNYGIDKIIAMGKAGINLDIPFEVYSDKVEKFNVVGNKSKVTYKKYKELVSYGYVFDCEDYIDKKNNGFAGWYQNKSLLAKIIRDDIKSGKLEARTILTKIVCGKDVLNANDLIGLFKINQVSWGDTVEGFSSLRYSDVLMCNILASKYACEEGYVDIIESSGVRNLSDFIKINQDMKLILNDGSGKKIELGSDLFFNLAYDLGFVGDLIDLMPEFDEANETTRNYTSNSILSTIVYALESEEKERVVSKLNSCLEVMDNKGWLGFGGDVKEKNINAVLDFYEDRLVKKNLPEILVSLIDQDFHFTKRSFESWIKLDCENEYENLNKFKRISVKIKEKVGDYKIDLDFCDRVLEAIQRKHPNFIREIEEIGGFEYIDSLKKELLDFEYSKSFSESNEVIKENQRKQSHRF